MVAAMTEGHTLPHAPQLVPSVWMFTHRPPHTAIGNEHATHAPELAQTVPAGHPTSQGVEQTPPTHRPEGHARPHAPQFIGSVAVPCSQPLAASPSQSAKPTMHEKPQRPATQARTPLIRNGQSTPQQLAGSVVDAQTSEGVAASAPGTQRPSRHVSSPRHECAHRPQFTGSRLVSEHPLRHEARPGAHSHPPSRAMPPTPQSADALEVSGASKGASPPTSAAPASGATSATSVASTTSAGTGEASARSCAASAGESFEELPHATTRSARTQSEARGVRMAGIVRARTPAGDGRRCASRSPARDPHQSEGHEPTRAQSYAARTLTSPVPVEGGAASRASSVSRAAPRAASSASAANPR